MTTQGKLLLDNIKKVCGNNISETDALPIPYSKAAKQKSRLVGKGNKRSKV